MEPIRPSAAALLYAPNSWIDRLPADVLRMILDLLEFSNLLRCAQVNRKWRLLSREPTRILKSFPSSIQNDFEPLLKRKEITPLGINRYSCLSSLCHVYPKTYHDLTIDAKLLGIIHDTFNIQRSGNVISSYIDRRVVDGNFFYVLSSDGNVYKWDVADQRLLYLNRCDWSHAGVKHDAPFNSEFSISFLGFVGNQAFVQIVYTDKLILQIVPDSSEGVRETIVLSNRFYFRDVKTAFDEYYLIGHDVVVLQRAPLSIRQIFLVQHDNATIDIFVQKDFLYVLIMQALIVFDQRTGHELKRIVVICGRRCIVVDGIAVIFSYSIRNIYTLQFVDVFKGKIIEKLSMPKISVELLYERLKMYKQLPQLNVTSRESCEIQ